MQAKYINFKDFRFYKNVFFNAMCIKSDNIMTWSSLMAH